MSPTCLTMRAIASSPLARPICTTRSSESIDYFHSASIQKLIRSNSKPIHNWSYPASYNSFTIKIIMLTNPPSPTRQQQRPQRRNQDEKTLNYCCGTHELLSLKMVNLSSENQILKNQASKLKDEIARLLPYQNAFKQSIRATQSILHEQNHPHINLLNIPPATPPRKIELSLFNSAIPELQQSSFSMSKVCLKSEPIEANSIVEARSSTRGEESPRLRDYRLLGRINSKQDRETIKSLEFSLQSKSVDQLSNSQSEWQEEREELHVQFERIRKGVEQKYESKIRVLEHEVQRLKKENWDLELKIQRLQDHHNGDEIRQTAFFQEPSFRMNSGSSIHQGRRTTESGCSQLMGHAEQLKVARDLLIALKEVNQNVGEELWAIVDELSNLREWSMGVKMLPVAEYLHLLEGKKREGIALGRCQILEQQAKQLRRLLSH